MSPLASIGLEEFRRRKASVDRAVAARRYRREDGEQLLTRWATIALAAGAAPREISAVHEAWQEDAGLSDVYARHILLEQGPSHAEYIAELARARDAAGEKARANPAEHDLSVRHHALDSLCIYLGGPSEQPATSERKAA